MEEISPERKGKLRTGREKDHRSHRKIFQEEAEDSCCQYTRDFSKITWFLMFRIHCSEVTGGEEMQTANVVLCFQKFWWKDEKTRWVAARQGWCGWRKICFSKIKRHVWPGWWESGEQRVERKNESLMEDQVGKIKPDLDFGEQTPWLLGLKRKRDG